MMTMKIATDHYAQICSEKVEGLPIDRTPSDVLRLYPCVTMWHETPSEMTESLISLFYLDLDQNKSLQENAKQSFNQFRYELEIHIVFDDAYEWMHYDRVPNGYVRQFLECVKKAAKAVYGDKTLHPVTVNTPYGTRIEWRLPGGNDLVVHLKDNQKIRIKKRWSQAMYMYYLILYRLLALNLDETTLRKRANNTFILTLDGDMSYRPDAPKNLMRVMLSDPELSAACGRIHAAGSGPIIWYQHFEYAYVYWMQHAADDIAGSMICTPGCFSMFRVSKLIEILPTFSKTFQGPEHYLMYDQGEDRWLATLLIQHGYRVDYSATLQVFMGNPETLPELFAQRRRWNTTIAANTFHLLSSYKNVLKTNKRVTPFFFLYEFMCWITVFFGQTTLLFTLIDGFSAVTGLSKPLLLSFNVLILSLYSVVCFKFNKDIQFKVSRILGVFYMGMILWPHIVSLTLVGVIDFFTVTKLSYAIFMAVIHPLEFHCILSLAPYVLLTPLVQLILPIYSVANLNAVSWGTRDTNVHASKNGMTNGVTKTNGFAKRFGLESLCGCEKTRNLSESETRFWNSLIEKVLPPLNPTEKEKNVFAGKMTSLRDRIAVLFFGVNIILVVTEFVALVLGAELHIFWPFMVFQPNYQSWNEFFRLDWQLCSMGPVHFVLSSYIYFLFCLQIIGMLLHRIKTIKQLIQLYRWQNMTRTFTKFVKKTSLICKAKIASLIY